MRQLQPRIDGAAEQLQLSLDGALAVTLQSQSPVALGVCLHAYAAIARPQAAEAVVRATLVAPVVHQAVADQKAKAQVGGPSAGTRLGDVLAAVTEGLKAQCAPFLEHTMSQVGWAGGSACVQSVSRGGGGWCGAPSQQQRRAGEVWAGGGPLHALAQPAA